MTKNRTPSKVQHPNTTLKPSHRSCVNTCIFRTEMIQNDVTKEGRLFKQHLLCRPTMLLALPMPTFSWPDHGRGCFFPPESCLTCGHSRIFGYVLQHLLSVTNGIPIDRFSEVRRVDFSTTIGKVSDSSGPHAHPPVLASVQLLFLRL